MENIKLIIAGDLFPKTCHELFSRGETGQLFSDEIIALFKEADLSVCNLEGVLTSSEEKRAKCGPSIKAPPEAARGIKALGINYVSLANNHSTDYGSEGYRETVSALEKNGIGYFGGGDNIDSIITHIRIRIKNKTFIIYGVSETVFNIPTRDEPGANLYDEYRVCKELETLKSQCDYLLVLYHGGVEYFQFPTPWVRQRFHRMADSGADAVIAQHTHCIVAQEVYNGSYLLYGQGNFHFAQDNETSITKNGLVLEISVNENKLAVKPHLVEMKDNMTIYDPDQDLTDFYRRSERLQHGDLFEKEFSEYSEGWMVKWLMEFRGLTLKDRAMRKILGKAQFVEYLRKSYSDHTVLRMLEHVRGEEDVEVMQRGLTDFFSLK